MDARLKHNNDFNVNWDGQFFITSGVYRYFVQFWFVIRLHLIIANVVPLFNIAYRINVKYCFVGHASMD